MSLRLLSVLLAACLLLSSADAGAGPSWSGDGVIVCVRARAQDQLRGVPLPGGAAFFAWRDNRSGVDRDLYAQIVEPTGAVRWPMNGLSVCLAAGDQEEPIVLADGAGGAIVVWTDTRDGDLDIYAQRVDGTGTPLWTADGVAVCDLPIGVYGVAAATDGAGGVIVAWSDGRRGYEIDVWAQRVSPGGDFLWETGGVAVCADTMAQYDVAVAPDGGGGAWFAWRDARRRASIRDAPCDLYAGRISHDGALSSERLVGDELVENYNPAIAADGSGNAILVWEDRPLTGGSLLRAQKIETGIVFAWADTAEIVAVRPFAQVMPLVCADGAGGAAIVWQENNGADTDLYAQRMDQAGGRLWGDGGVPVVVAPENQTNASICPDDSSGVVVAWHDLRGGYLTEDVYAQRIGGDGVARWPAGGLPVCARGERSLYPVAVPIGSGRTVFGWLDSRYDGYLDIFAQLVAADGEVVATFLRGFDASAAGDGVVVSWRVGADGSPRFRAERRSRNTDWLPVDVRIDSTEPGHYLFRDEPGAGRTIRYRVRVDDGGVTRTLFETDWIDTPAATISLRCGPNPFNPSTTVFLALPSAGPVDLAVYDASGRLVRHLARGRFEAGRHEVSWDERNARGVPCAAGVYWCRLRAGKARLSTTMALVR